MQSTAVFDVLIVYNTNATSAGTAAVGEVMPFADDSGYEGYNVVYAYFLAICRKNKLKAAFTTSADIIGPGKCSSYWLFKRNKWQRVEETGYAQLIFDKLSPISKKFRASRELMLGSKKVRAFNQKDLFDIFFDKQKTYDQLAQFSAPTVSVVADSKAAMEKACRQLKVLVKKHPFPDDFSSEIVMKDRFGAGGRDVYKFKAGQAARMADVMQKRQKAFILQPLVKFDRVDIRLIYLSGKMVQTYIRTAKEGDFRCNEHQGGILEYIAKAELPAAVIRQAKKLIKFLDKKTALFSLDFMISTNGNVYLIEGNTGPGLDWNVKVKKNVRAAQKLIRLIVLELVKITYA